MSMCDHPKLQPAEPVWDVCEVELRCQERQARTYPLCRYEAIVVGSAGRYVAGRSAEFDNGINGVERTSVLAILTEDLAEYGWEPISPTRDRMPRFRRRVRVAMI